MSAVFSSKGVFERRKPTESETFPLLICIDAIRLVLLSVRTLIRTICPKIWAKINNAKKSTFGWRCRSKTSLLKLSLNGEPPAAVDRVGPAYQRLIFTVALLTVLHVYNKTFFLQKPHSSNAIVRERGRQHKRKSKENWPSSLQGFLASVFG